MKDTKEVTACVIDTCGNYVSLADRLGREYKQVFYCIPSWQDGYPKPNKSKIGEGLETVTVIDNPFDVFDSVDLWIFPDVYYGSFQEWLKVQGEITWGSGAAEELELYRDICKEQMTELKLPVNPWLKITGFSALKDYLQNTENVWVKVNKYRGLVETFYHKNYKLTEPALLDIEHGLGSIKEDIEFIAEEPIDGALEQGYDGYTVDGAFPNQWLSGCEVKDKAYIGQIKAYSDLSPLLTEFNSAFTDTYKKYGYRGFVSLENRIIDRVSYMTDFTARMPCPPGEIYLEIFENLGEIIWAGAQGFMVPIDAKKKFGIELLIESNWSIDHFCPVYFPPKLGQFIKLKKFNVKDKITTIIPQANGTSDIGSIIGIGDSLEEAKAQIIDIAEQIEGTDIVIRIDALDTAQECLDLANTL